jgi:alpha-L-fucosidase
MDLTLPLALCLALAAVTALAATPPPAPYGPTPSARQLQWHDVEVYGFLHFGVNTFTDREWGLGDEPEAIFNPTDFDADQIASVLAGCGMRGVVLTAKHHDGFCLWPSKYTEHSVRNSPWQDGKGDVVGEIAAAARRHGLLFGVYLSPWDRNHAEYARPGYVTYYHDQLRELLSTYGPMFEVWFDGANGGDGYYGGARETRSIDGDYYQWGATYGIVRELQPEACMFGGPDVRWVGNESGWAPDPCWSTGDRHGQSWIPAEVDVSIRPGWFYHASEDNAVKSVSHLLRIYYESVGLGCNLILNIPPDRRGRIHENDAAALSRWGEILRQTFAHNLAQGAVATADNTRGGAREGTRGEGDPAYAPANVLDNDRSTYWASDDAVSTPSLTLTLPAPVTFNVVRLREFIKLGQRVDGFALDAFEDGQWREFFAAQSIGNQRLVRTRYITTDRVRLRITGAPVCPAISELALFAAPVLLSDPVISRDRDGMVTIACDDPGPWIRYTLDGSAPTAASPLYTAPLALPAGGTVRAVATLPQDGASSGIVSRSYGVSKVGWRVVETSFPGTDASPLLDGDPETIWHTADGKHAPPQWVTVDMGASRRITGFTMLPRPASHGTLNGTPDRYEFYVSEDCRTWGEPVAAGEFPNIRANPVLQTVRLTVPLTARYFRFVATHALDDMDHVAFAELGTLTD